VKATDETRAVAIIPVRVDSQRLPGKALLAETGQALFLHTCEQARRAGCFDEILVATDSPEILAVAEAAGVTPVLTSGRPRTGSERCAEAAAAIERDCRVVVDIQSDWPEVDPSDLRRIVAALADSDAASDHACATLAARLEDVARIDDPNVVKVARGRSGEAVYFSRLPIPYRRDPERHPSLLRHIGVYAFTLPTLLRVPELPDSDLEEREGLEQLRFIENGIRIQVLDATGDPWGIECRADYDAFLHRHRRHETDPTS
jgi:3-deoxy-manno-octulosonate cytidylyltransferase (CMP-KDO synthetase)